MSDVTMFNLMRLQAAALELFTLGESGRPSADRVVAVQQLGQEVEDRAQALIDEVRELRGFDVDPEPPPRRAPEALAPPAAMPADNGLSGAQVRDVIVRLRAFTASELANELDVPDAKVKPYIKAYVAGGQLREVGKVMKKPMFEYVAPEGSSPPRPRRTPPEKLPPSGTESRATGEPVRVSAAKKSTRRQRSTAGQSLHIRLRDQRYEQSQAAKERRAQQNREKAERDMAKLKGMRGGKKK